MNGNSFIKRVQETSNKQAAGVFLAAVITVTGGTIAANPPAPAMERVATTEHFETGTGVGAADTPANVSAPPEVAPAPESPAEPAPAPAPAHVNVPVDDNLVASPFEYRYGVNPLLPADYPELHNGIDFAGDFGDPVRAVHHGTVVYAKWHDEGGGGNRIVVDHGDGHYSTYNHLQEIFVTTGDTVEHEQLIGSVGSTGNSTGPHLHFEAGSFEGGDYDPAPHLPAWNEGR